MMEKTWWSGLVHGSGNMDNFLHYSILGSRDQGQNQQPDYNLKDPLPNHLLLLAEYHFLKVLQSPKIAPITGKERT